MRNMDREFLELLKSKVSIIDVVSSRIRLRRSGRDWFGLCPFHSEKTGSLKIDSDRGYYYCFGCGVHGDVINFVQDFDKVSFSEAVEYLAHLYGIPLPHRGKIISDPYKPVYDAMVEIKNWFVKQLAVPIGENAHVYLKSRGISQESAEKFQLGFAPHGDELLRYLRNQGISDDTLLKTGVYRRSKQCNGMVNRYAGRLMFPILNSVGKCVGFGGRILGKDDSAKYINSPETNVFTKSDHLYGYFLAKRSKIREIVLVEGYLDVISLHQAGFDGAVASLGTSISESHINMCWNVCDSPIISLDGDSAGVCASYRWVDKILLSLRAGKSFRFARLPQGSDPDQLVFSGQSDAIRNALSNAMPLSEWVWEGAFLLYPSETPEQKAAIVKMLLNKVHTIPDVSVKKLYIQSIKRKEQGLYLQKSNSIARKENIRPVVSVQEKLEKIFIVTLLNHPHIVGKVIESLAQLEPENFQLRRLKDQILDCYGQNGESKEYIEIMLSLKEKYAKEMEDAELHAKFSCDKTTDEEAIKGWYSLMDRYHANPSIIADLQMATSNLKSSFLESDWRRLKALKQEIISRTQK
ncbi:MAG: DNA primase [Holosporaceae bacterium]|jgi:DNA primase|nr:DNA primase [Holosporaceae bacterium]